MKKVFVFLLIWIGLAAVAWIYGLTQMPSSIREWVLFFLVGPLAFLLASLLFEGLGLLFMRLPGIRHVLVYAERRGEGRELSGLRVLTYLCTSLVGIGLVLAAVWLWHRL